VGGEGGTERDCFPKQPRRKLNFDDEGGGGHKWKRNLDIIAVFEKKERLNPKSIMEKGRGGGVGEHYPTT